MCAAFHHNNVEILLQVGSHSLKRERGFSHPALSFKSPDEFPLDLDGMLKQDLGTADDARKITIMLRRSNGELKNTGTDAHIR